MSENKASSSSASEAGRITARGLGGRRIRVLAQGGQSFRVLAQDERLLYWSDDGDGTATSSAFVVSASLHSSWSPRC